MTRTGTGAGAGTKSGDGTGVGSRTTAETRAAAATNEQNINLPEMMIGGGHFVGCWRWMIYGEAGRAFSETESRGVVRRASSCTIPKAFFLFYEFHASAVQV